MELQRRKLSKARRVCFLRNLDTHFEGLSLIISRKHYRVFRKLLEALTVALTQHLVLKSAITRIYRVDGQRIFTLNDIYEGDIIVCCCKREAFVDVGYNINRSHVEYLGSIVRKNLKDIEYMSEEDYMLQFTPDQMPPCITLYFDIFRHLSKTEHTLIFEACGKFNKKLNYIVKMVDRDHMCVRSRKDYLEIETLRKLQSHDNIVELIISVELPLYVFIIFERLDCDLLSLKLMFDYPFEESFVQLIMINVAKGLEYIHSCRIIHRDIKLENLLVKYNPGSEFPSFDIAVIKIADFGLSTFYEGRDLFRWCGTSNYMAPELINYEGYDYCIDCWSLGVTLYYLLCDRFPFGDDHSKLDDILECIKKDCPIIPEEYESNLSIEAHHLINSLLDKSRKSRITATEIRSHPFLQLGH